MHTVQPFPDCTALPGRLSQASASLHPWQCYRPLRLDPSFLPNRQIPCSPACLPVCPSGRQFDVTAPGLFSTLWVSFVRLVCLFVCLFVCLVEYNPDSKTPETLPLVALEIYPRRSCFQHENRPENTQQSNNTLLHSHQNRDWRRAQFHMATSWQENRGGGKE